MTTPHYVLVRPWAVYVKDGAFFEQQGGLKEAWGEAWEKIDAVDLDAAYDKAFDMQKERYGKSTRM